MILFTKRERERSSLFSCDTNFLGDIHGYNTSIQFTQNNYFYNNTYFYRPTDAISYNTAKLSTWQYYYN